MLFGIQDVFTYRMFLQELTGQFKCSNCDDVTAVFMKPGDSNAGRINELKAYGVDAMPKIDSAFYFDTTVRALKATK